MEIDPRLVSIFRDVFEDDSLEVTAATSAGQVEGWDSVAHITLVFSVEEEFGFQFTSRELENMKNVGDLQTIVTRRSSYPQ